MVSVLFTQKRKLKNFTGLESSSGNQCYHSRFSKAPFLQHHRYRNEILGPARFTTNLNDFPKFILLSVQVIHDFAIYQPFGSQYDTFDKNKKLKITRYAVDRDYYAGATLKLHCHCSQQLVATFCCLPTLSSPPFFLRFFVNDEGTWMFSQHHGPRRYDPSLVSNLAGAQSPI